MAIEEFAYLMDGLMTKYWGMLYDREPRHRGWHLKKITAGIPAVIFLFPPGERA
jgi:hypothetical protein